MGPVTLASMDISHMLKDVTITGVHCSVCDFLITVYGPHTNDDFRAATNAHTRLYHQVGKTSYDIRATKKIMIEAPVTRITLKHVIGPSSIDLTDAKVTMKVK